LLSDVCRLDDLVSQLNALLAELSHVEGENEEQLRVSTVISAL
jgi:hypothetical protein